ncbi:MAG: DUF58 domain-containing protein [Methylophilaceae bacterium]
MAKESRIHYRIGWKPSGQQPGAKRGLSAGIGDQLRSMVLLRDHPDPRRLDLRASIRDPFERLWVRDFTLNTAFKVIVLLDASASMRYNGVVNRIKVVEDIVVQLAISAYRSGDAFGLFAANTRIIKSATLPPKINKSAWLWAQRNIAKIPIAGNSAAGLLDVIPQLSRQRSLVFVISDFRWPAEQYKQLLKGLNHHDVVPVMLQDPAEVTDMPTYGIASVKDMETGQAQFLWMRPALKQKIEHAYLQQIQRIQSMSYRYGVKPFLVPGVFNSTHLNQYFMERHGA